MSRPRICARSIDAGPGSCGYWWDSCPANVGHCFQRHVAEHGERTPQDTARFITRDQAQAWAAERDRAVTPAQGALL